MISSQFSVSIGSVPGMIHRRALRNNQDGVGAAENSHGLVAIVCDGCSAGAHTEVGAHLMARFLAQRGVALLKRNALTGRWDLTRFGDRRAFLVHLHRQALDFLEITLAWMGGDRLQSIQDLFLFTIIGAAITPQVSFVFSQGDGVYETNGDYEAIDEGNKPRYLAYALVNREHLAKDPGPSALVERTVVATDELDTLRIGSDGAAVLERRKDEPLKDGASQGGFAQFDDPRYVRNRSALHKRLAVIGVLNRRAADDLTLVSIRRRERP